MEISSKEEEGLEDKYEIIGHSKRKSLLNVQPSQSQSIRALASWAEHKSTSPSLMDKAEKLINQQQSPVYPTLPYQVDTR